MNNIKLFEDWNNKEPEWNDSEHGCNLAAGILPVCKKTKRILVALRSDEVLDPNTWGTFGGRIERKITDPKIIETEAIREFREETNYDGKIELVNAYIFRDDDQDFKYYNFFGLIEDEFNPVLNWENADAEWMSLDELHNLSDKHFGLEALIKEAGHTLNKILNY